VLTLSPIRLVRACLFSYYGSCRSDDYSKNSAPHKALILSKVVAGKGYEVTTNMQNLRAPPQGYDSVIGEPSRDGTLNYDELVVFNDAAILPAYLVIYG